MLKTLAELNLGDEQEAMDTIDKGVNIDPLLLEKVIKAYRNVE